MISAAAEIPPPAAAPPPSSDFSAARVRLVCDILSRVPVPDLEPALNRTGQGPHLLPSDAESVLLASYSLPASAVKFFRWSGLHLKHSPRAWNLVVDILGKYGLFEPMWDAIRSMRHEPSALSVATFASAFGSYCSAGKIKEAVMTFDVMERYGVAQDTVALNSLLSAICRLDGLTADAAKVFDGVKTRIPPDADTFAILLEGWEKEGNLKRAKTTFGEMVVRIGWDAKNMSAYDAFLTTLVRGQQADEAIKFLKVMKSKGCLPGLKFFANALDILVKNNDAVHAVELWDMMVVDSGLVPNLVMYNAIIALVCNNNDFGTAYRFLDAMPFHGVFPDILTFNMIFECLIRNRKAKEAENFFLEMKKNEQLPSPSNCFAAIRLFFEEFNPMTAIDVWSYAVEERLRLDDDCANELLLGLANFGRLSDIRKYADEMLDMGVHLQSSTMDKLKVAFAKGRREDMFDRIARRVKRRLDR